MTTDDVDYYYGSNSGGTIRRAERCAGRWKKSWKCILL